MRSCPSCGNETDGSYCSNCGHETISSMMIEPIIKKKSKFWYLFPIIFGLLGGAIAYFALRKSDPSKAKICLILGLGITVAYFVYIGSYDSSSDDTPQLTTNQQEREIQTDRAAEEARYQAELERQRAAEEARYQAELERQRVAEEASASKFDPIVVEAFHRNIGDILSLPREILKQCRAVNNYSDYLTFAMVIAATQDEVNLVISGTGLIIDDLELKGYCNHPTVGPKITEIKQLFDSNVSCIEGLLAKYN